MMRSTFLSFLNALLVVIVSCGTWAASPRNARAACEVDKPAMSASDSGLVVESDGKTPVANATVRFLRRKPSSSGVLELLSATSNAEGSVALPPVPFERGDFVEIREQDTPWVTRLSIDRVDSEVAESRVFRVMEKAVLRGIVVRQVVGMGASEEIAVCGIEDDELCGSKCGPDGKFEVRIPLEVLPTCHYFRVSSADHCTAAIPFDVGIYHRVALVPAARLSIQLRKKSTAATREDVVFSGGGIFVSILGAYVGSDGKLADSHSVRGTNLQRNAAEVSANVFSAIGLVPQSTVSVKVFGRDSSGRSKLIGSSIAKLGAAGEDTKLVIDV